MKVLASVLEESKKVVNEVKSRKAAASVWQ